MYKTYISVFTGLFTVHIEGGLLLVIWDTFKPSLFYGDKHQKTHIRVLYFSNTP